MVQRQWKRFSVCSCIQRQRALGIDLHHRTAKGHERRQCSQHAGIREISSSVQDTHCDSQGPYSAPWLHAEGFLVHGAAVAQCTFNAALDVDFCVHLRLCLRC